MNRGLLKITSTKTEFKEFEQRLKFETRLKKWLVPLKIVVNVSRFKQALN